MWKNLILGIGIIALAVSFRFAGINWDSGAHLHPDERFLTMVTTSISWPSSIPAYFDTNTSPLNPHNVGHKFYVYGTYPVYLTKLVAQFFQRDTYDGVPLVGRSLSGIIDLMTLLFVFCIAKHLASYKTALFASFLYAVMVLPIQQSHFYTVDPYATLFLTIALYLLIKKRIGVALGLAVGLAISAKISSVLILLPVGFVWIKQRKLVPLFVFLLVTAATVRITYPYLFDGWSLNPLVLENWKQLKSFDGPITSFPPALQWINVPVWQPTVDLMVWGLGLPLGILAVIALLFGPNLLLLSWVLLVLGVQSLQFAKAMRYLYPIYPALAVLSAQFLIKLSSRSFIRLFVYLLIELFMVWPLAFTSVYRKPHTRISASEWIYAHIPRGSVIAWEHWDDPLPLSRSINTIGAYATFQLSMYDPDTVAKWQKITNELSKTDYVILSSNRVYGSVAHAKVRYPLTNRYYQLLFSGELGFQKTAEFTSRPTLFGFEFIDDNAEESFTVYDHPRVLIYQNKARLSKETLYSLIYE